VSGKLDKVPVVPPKSRRDIEKLALLTLQAFQPEALKGKLPPPVDVEGIYELYIPTIVDVRTGYGDLSTLLGRTDVLGFTHAPQKISLVDSSLSDAIDQVTLRRFRATVGHEGGHCIIHVPLLQVFKSLSIDLGEDILYRQNRNKLRPFEDPEWQAWEFARALIMPRPLVIDYRERGFTSEEMANCFEVNPAFLRVRLQTLKIKAP
jgi:hypothetical protein